VVFKRELREGVRRGRIRCSIRIWMQPKVKAGGRYQMDDGYIVVDSIEPIQIENVTEALARESGFATVKELLATARHGGGTNVYLVRFHYLPPGVGHSLIVNRDREWRSDLCVCADSRFTIHDSPFTIA